jgi:hypothetical protein
MSATEQHFGQPNTGTALRNHQIHRSLLRTYCRSIPAKSIMLKSRSRFRDRTYSPTGLLCQRKPPAASSQSARQAMRSQVSPIPRSTRYWTLVGVGLLTIPPRFISGFLRALPSQHRARRVESDGLATLAYTYSQVHSFRSCAPQCIHGANFVPAVTLSFVLLCCVHWTSPVVGTVSPGLYVCATYYLLERSSIRDELLIDAPSTDRHAEPHL